MKKFLEFYNEKKRACKEFFEGQQQSKKTKTAQSAKEKDAKSKKDVLLVDQDYSINLSEIVKQKKIKKRSVTFKVNLNSSVDVEASIIKNNETIMTIENHDTVNVPVCKEQKVELKVTPKVESSELSDIDLGLRLGKSKINYSLTAYRFDFIADLNKDKIVKRVQDKASSLSNDLAEISEINIRKFGPDNHPESLKLNLELNEKDAKKVRLASQKDNQAKALLGEGKKSIRLEDSMFKNNTMKLYAQALNHQDKNFDGLIDLKLTTDMQGHNQKMLKPIYSNDQMNPSILDITFFVDPRIEKPVEKLVEKKEIEKPVKTTVEIPNMQEPKKITTTTATEVIDDSALSLVKQAEEIVQKVCTRTESSPGYLNRPSARIQDRNRNRISKRRKDQKKRANLDMAFKIPRDRELATLPNFSHHISNFSYSLHTKTSANRLPAAYMSNEVRTLVNRFNNKYSSSIR